MAYFLINILSVICESFKYSEIVPLYPNPMIIACCLFILYSYRFHHTEYNAFYTEEYNMNSIVTLLG